MELYRAIVKLDQENPDGVQVCTASNLLCEDL